MAHNAKYGVKFVGYSAHVIRKGREVEYAALDFVTGRASVNADQGWVNSKCRSCRIRREASNTQHRAAAAVLPTIGSKLQGN
jgi:hypothetical protein